MIATFTVSLPVFILGMLLFVTPIATVGIVWMEKSVHRETCRRCDTMGWVHPTPPKLDWKLVMGSVGVAMLIVVPVILGAIH